MLIAVWMTPPWPLRLGAWAAYRPGRLEHLQVAQHQHGAHGQHRDQGNVPCAGDGLVAPVLWRAYAQFLQFWRARDEWLEPHLPERKVGVLVVVGVHDPHFRPFGAAIEAAYVAEALPRRMVVARAVRDLGGDAARVHQGNHAVDVGLAGGGIEFAHAASLAGRGKTAPESGLANADQAFLGSGRHQGAVAAEDLAAGQAPATLRGGAVEGIQQPFVDPEGPVEPQGMVQAGHLHVVGEVGNPMRQRRRADQVEIRGIGQQHAVQRRCVVDRRDQLEPDVLQGRALGRPPLVAWPDLAELEGAVDAQPALQLDRQPVQLLGWPRLQRFDVFGRRHFGHRGLVLDTGFRPLEGHRAGQDRLAVLDGHDAPRGERAAVARTLHAVHDWRLDVAGAQEVGMQGMCFTRAVDSLLRSRERLAQYLTTKDEARANVAALAAEQVV